jgi:membrane protease YdiL (CAAX protease family)
MSRFDDLWRREHWWDPPPDPPTTPPYAEAAIVSGVAVSHVIDHLAVPQRFHLGTHLAAAAGAVAAALAAGATIDDLGLRPDRIPHGLRRGAVSVVGIAAVIGLGAALPRTRQWFDDERVLDVTVGEALFRGLVEIPIGTAVYEEVVFRGVVFGLALRRLPPLPAALATSALFGLWHVLPSLRDRERNPATRQQHPAAVTTATVVNTAAVGLTLAWQRLRTNSVVAPILTHTASNAIAYLAAAALARRPQGASASLQLRPAHTGATLSARWLPHPRPIRGGSP